MCAGQWHILASDQPAVCLKSYLLLFQGIPLLLIHKKLLNVMLCVQDSGVPLPSDQPAVYKTLFTLLFFFSTLLFFCLQKMVVECHALYAGQWRASGHSLACSMCTLLLFLFKAFLFFRVQHKTLSVMLCMQDSVVSVASHQPAVCLDSGSFSARHSSSSIFTIRRYV